MHLRVTKKSTIVKCMRPIIAAVYQLLLREYNQEGCDEEKCAGPHKFVVGNPKLKEQF